MAWNRRMKISQNSYRSLESAIRRVLAAHPDAVAKYGGVTKLLLWDLFWASKFPASDLYNAGLNDNAIETVLKNIVGDAETAGLDCAGGSCAAAFRGGMRGLGASLPDIVSADRVQWSLLTTAQIRKVMTEAGQYGDFVLVKKARAALARRGVR